MPKHISTQDDAARKLIEYACSPENASSTNRYARLLRSLAKLAEDCDLDVTATVWTYLGGALDAEGSASFAGIDKPGWAAEVFRKAALFKAVEDHYDAFILGESVDRVGELHRDTPEWNEIVRRNITLPRGLVYEVEAVRRRLDEGDPPRKISFSGLLELALREVLQRPSDEDDARFCQEGDFWYEPETDTRTISDLVRDHGIGARRTAINTEAS